MIQELLSINGLNDTLQDPATCICRRVRKMLRKMIGQVLLHATRHLIMVDNGF